MDLRKTGRRNQTTFIKEDGNRFFGRLVSPLLSRSKTNSFLQPRRILLVDFNQNIHPGDCFQIEDQLWGIVIQNADGYYADPIYKSYGIVIADQEASWKRRISEKDPFTGLETTVGYEDLGIIRYNADFQHYEQDQLKISSAVRSIVSGKELKPFDMIGDSLQIQNVHQSLGVYVGQLKGVVK